jgi:hypothetical protein
MTKFFQLLIYQMLANLSPKINLDTDLGELFNPIVLMVLVSRSHEIPMQSSPSLLAF